MDKINMRVLIKEPRGFLRLLQILFGVFAWSTTSSFYTISKLQIFCPDETAPYVAEYAIKYPFDLRNVNVSSPQDCTDDTNVVNESFPIDFSTTSMLYVFVCATSLAYAIGSAFYYCFLTAKYETDPLAPVVDLGVSILFTLLWIFVTCTWALNVSDLKHYTHPNNFAEYLLVCKDAEANCQPQHPGKWSSLTVSIICGFTCAVLWIGSSWFIFKETNLHKKQAYQSTGATTSSNVQQNMAPQQTGI